MYIVKTATTQRPLAVTGVMKDFHAAMITEMKRCASAEDAMIIIFITVHDVVDWLVIMTLAGMMTIHIVMTAAQVMMITVSISMITITSLSPYFTKEIVRVT